MENEPINERDFSEMFLKYSRWLFMKAYAECRDTDEAKDIVQEVFIAVWKNRKRIDPNKDIRAYLFISVKNAVRERYDKAMVRLKYQKKLLRESPDEIDNSYKDADEETDDVKGKEFIRMVDDIPNKLTKEAVKAIYIEGISYKELAAKTNRSVQHLRNCVSQGLAYLRNKIKNASMPVTKEYDTHFNYIDSITLTADVVRKCSHSGKCDDDLKECRKIPEVAEQLSKINPIMLREELKEYGAWSDKELENHDRNLTRILWIAAGNIFDESDDF